MRFKLWFLALLALIGLSAQASEMALSPEIRALPFKALNVYTSQPGERLQAFLLRIAPVLQAYTRKTGWEACGVIGQGPQGYGVALGTNQS